MNDNTQAAIRVFAQRDFRDWQGLAPDTSLSDVAAVFSVGDDLDGAAKLGSERRAATWISTAADGYENGVRIWLDENSVLLLDGDSPALTTELTAVLESIGEPDAKLDAYLGTFSIAESEWVYAGRGLTIYLDPEDLTLFRIVVYAPTSLDKYMESLRLNLQTRRLPLSDDRL